MKKILILLVSVFSTLSVYSQTINISLDYAGLINEPVQGQTTSVTALEIGDEFYLDVTILNSDNSVNKVTYADIWFTFKNDAFEYLGVENPLTNNSWYTYQWPSVYRFNTSTNHPSDDMYLQYNHSNWSYIGEQSLDAPMVITSQATGEINGVVARLKFRYKQVPNGFDFSNSAILRKAYARDNVRGVVFTDVKAFPNQTFNNVPTSTKVTASFKLMLPESLDGTLFDGGLYTADLQNQGSWVQPQYAIYENFSSTNTLDITQGFNRTDSLAVIVNWDGYVVDTQNGDYTITFEEQYDDMVTISDVALAFAELNNRGINQDEFGNEFNYGIQFMNADVDSDGDFDSDDTYKLLAQVLDVSTYMEQNAMVYASKFYPKAQYDTITKTNYSQFSNGTSLMNYLDNKDNSKLQFEFQAALTWKGDVNLSHSTEPAGVAAQQAATVSKGFVPSYAKAMNKTERQIGASITTELIEGKVVATITIEPLSQKLIGTQFKVGFDESKLTFDDINFQTNNTSTNFSNVKNGYINIGSLVQVQNQFLDNKTKYILTFTPNVQLENTLGLVILKTTDAVNAVGEQLKMNIQ